MAASDESFGFKEHLLVPDEAAFTPGHYDHRGEVVDGWETHDRRGESGGHDWAIIRLGAPGVINAVDVDTSFFTGNYPPYCRIEACGAEGHPSPAELNGPDTEWFELVPRAPLNGDSHNLFPVTDPRRFTHVRLSIEPDGGVARLRAYGHVVPDPRNWHGVSVDLASQEQGGLVVADSDSFYSPARVLNRPDRARTMGEGWETSRRRDDGHDIAVIALAASGRLRQAEIDTTHFKYNASAEVELWASRESPAPDPGSADWFPLLPRTVLQPDTRHLFRLDDAGPVSAVRVDAFPDGGMSRIRLTGIPTPAAWAEAAARWFNTLPAGQARACLLASGVSAGETDRLVASRPRPTGSLPDSINAVLTGSGPDGPMG